MITDFPNVKKAFHKVLDQKLKEEFRQKAPLVAMIGRKKLFEGNTLGVMHANGDHNISKLRAVQSGFSIPQDRIASTTSEALLSKVGEAAEDMASQVEKDLFSELDRVITASGNNISGNPELGPEAILQALEKIQIDFEDDDRRRPVRPTIIAAPSAAHRLMDLAAEETPEEIALYQKREEEILDRKYQEHMTDVESRKIVD